MKKYSFFLVIFFLVSCSTSVQLINKGKYDPAIDILVVDLSKDTGNEKNIKALDFAFSEANKNSNERINSMLTSGKPGIWFEIHHEFQKLEFRQEKIETLSDSVKEAISFKPVVYKLKLAESLKRACENLYENATAMITSGNKAEAQRAGFYLREIDSLMPGFKDVGKLLADLGSDTTIFIYYKVQNQNPGYLPAGLENELDELDISKFNTPKYEFVSKKPAYLRIKYEVDVDIIDIKLAPENTDEIYYAETATIQDGIAYKLDEAGNFVRDSLGNKIEIPKFKTIACYVTENNQKKSMLLGGSVEIIDHETGKTIAKRAVAGETRFNHKSAYFKGDINALSPETMELLGSKELEFPSDISMLLRASDKFGKNVADVVVDELEKLQSHLTKNE